MPLLAFTLRCLPYRCSEYITKGLEAVRSPLLGALMLRGSNLNFMPGILTVFDGGKIRSRGLLHTRSIESVHAFYSSSSDQIATVRMMPTRHKKIPTAHCMSVINGHNSFQRSLKLEPPEAAMVPARPDQRSRAVRAN